MAEQNNELDIVRLAKLLVASLPRCHHKTRGERCTRAATHRYRYYLGENWHGEREEVVEGYCADHAPKASYPLQGWELLQELQEALEKHDATANTAKEPLAEWNNPTGKR
jgi:hypothetical protein